MSRSLLKSVQLKDKSGKAITGMVLDQGAIPDGTLLFRISKYGEVLPKGTKPGPAHIHIIKSFKISAPGDASKKPDPIVFRVTRSEKGVFKQFWDEKVDGPKPKKEKKAKTGDNDEEKKTKPKKRTKDEEEEEDADQAALMALLAKIAAGNKKKKTKAEK